ncbi:MAG: hypothetical protein LUD72_03775, partial [Bacteroidales bacterium]|nr:hypothetical protein [Bacteroidales bacterium]
MMRLRVKLHRSYWDVRDEASQAQWEAVMPKWLSNMFYKVSNNIVASNKIRRQEGDKPLDYTWVEIEFDNNVVVSFKTQGDSSTPDEALQMVEQIRTLMSDQAFGSEEVACVRIPSQASYDAQVAAHVAEMEEAATAEAEKAAAEEKEKDGANDNASADAQDASEDTAAMEPADQEGEADEEVSEEPEETEKPTPPSMPDFDVDYTTWGIEYVDGTAREFDSAAGSFTS